MQFEKKITWNKTVATLTIPKDLATYLGIEEDSIIIMKDETNKRGQKFCSFWVKGK